MDSNGLRKFYWGFLFIMLSFRIEGIDIFPDILGYILLAVGFSKLSSRSSFFYKAAKYNVPLIILSALSIYERPNGGGFIYYQMLGGFGIVVAIINFILNLMVIYNLFMGIQDLANQQGMFQLEEGAEDLWCKYKILQISTLFIYILMSIPILGVVYILCMFIFTIWVMVKIMTFIKICAEEMNI